MSYPYPVPAQNQPVLPQPKSTALKVMIVLRNLCIALVVAVFLLYPAQFIWVSLFAPEMIDPQTKYDDVSQTGKWVMLLGSGPAFAILGVVNLIECLMKNSPGGTITIVIVLYGIAFFVSVFGALALLVMLDPILISMRGGSLL